MHIPGGIKINILEKESDWDYPLNAYLDCFPTDLECFRLGEGMGKEIHSVVEFTRVL